MREDGVMREGNILRVQELPPRFVTCNVAKVKAGEVLVGVTEEGELCRVSFLDGRQAGDVLYEWQVEWVGTRFTKGKIPKDFATLPMVEIGTEMQRIVWLAIMDIPYGQVMSYGEVAEQIGMPGRARAVGRACRMSHLAHVVPCHRVVAANGLGGFGSSGTVLKEALLKGEGIKVGSGKPEKAKATQKRRKAVA